MAYDVAELQAQVALATGHDNLASRVITWTNRVIQEIATRAYWQAQLAQRYISYENIGAVTSGALSNVWNIAGLTNVDLVNVYRMAHVKQSNATQISSYYHQVIRADIDGVAAKYGSAYTYGYSVGNDAAKYYAIAGWQNTITNSSSFGPKIMFFPNVSTTVTTTFAMQVHFLRAPTKFTAAADTNWLVTQHFSVVLSGVLRLARLYLGDAQGYLLEDREFEQGILQMLRSYESPRAATPVMRQIVPDDVRRG